MDHLDLYWIPAGAGTKARWWLGTLEWVASLAARRRARVICHAALKVELGGRNFTLELTPETPHVDVIPAPVTGAVGSSLAGRWRLFRYQLCCEERSELPDEQWTLAGPMRLTTDAAVIERLFETAARIPTYVWGRRTPGTSEMWTSNSAISWLLTTLGVGAGELPLPARAWAPGWVAGIEAATSPDIARATETAAATTAAVIRAPEVSWPAADLRADVHTVAVARITVRVTPRAAMDRIDGFDDAGRLRVRVTAPPADGAANAAVAKLLASALDLPGRDVTLVSGAASREKLFDVPLDAGIISARLAPPGQNSPHPRSRERGRG